MLLSKIESLHDENPKLYWQLINELQGRDSDENSHAVSSSNWFSHFRNLSEPKPESIPSINKLKIKLDRLEKIKSFTELDVRITESEISTAVSQLKMNKSPGLDNVSNNMLKFGQAYLLPSIHKIFNACFSFGKYPESWARGFIIPLHKSGDIHDPNNYRGITITNALGKLFNKVLDNRFDKFLEKYKIIDDCQIGFTHKARTSDHMFILRTLLDKYCKCKDGRLFACFVDFQKAFDTVIHTGIKIKLLQIGVGSNFYNIVNSMYSLSKSCVRNQGHITDFFQVNLGVKQGDNLSPNLFKVFINDLPKYMENTPDPAYLNTHPVHCLMYADDIVLLSSSAQGLQCKLDRLHSYCKEWCLNVNTTKTKILIFNKAGRHIYHKFVIDKTEIECVSSYKYLGITFCSSGSFSLAQKELYQKALKAFFKLRTDFFSLNPSVKTAIHVFDHTIKPILLYGSEIWGYFNPFTSKYRSGSYSLDNIYSNLLCDKVHIKFCKFILGVHKKTTNFGVLSEVGRFPLHFDIVKGMINYWHRLENLGSSFPLLGEAYLTSKILYDQKYPSWFGSLKCIYQNIQGLQELSSTTKIYRFKRLSKKLIFQHYVNLWQIQKNKHSVGKLDNYFNLKTNFGMEKYLSVLQNFEHRRNVARLRLSAHRLQIERGRYQGVLRHDRICLRCTSGEVDDEKHFLFSCSCNSDMRTSLYNTIKLSCLNFNSLSTNNKFIWLLNNENIEILSTISDMMISSGV